MANVVNADLYINYNANGGSGAPVRTVSRARVSINDLPYTVRATVSSSYPSRSGYTFLGWAYSASATSASVQGGMMLTHTFSQSSWTGSNLSYSYTLYAVWEANQYNVHYRGGTYASGQGTGMDIKYGNADLTLRGRMYTRSGYNQSGWSTNVDGNTYAYSLGGRYTANANITLYPYWSIIKSTISSVTASVPADGTTQGTVEINRPNSNFTHKVVISLGSKSQEFTNVATNQTFTIPASWLDQIPSATSATATVSLTTYLNGSQVGSPDTKNFTVTVPASVVPTITLTGTNVSDNVTVSGWGVLVQGFSKIQLQATTAAGSGSTVSSVVFSGDGISQPDATLSDILTNAGSRTWTATVTDARGRMATATLTRTVHEYYPASILAFAAYRSDSSGDGAPADGTYITASGNYSFASCGGNNSASVKKIEYAVHSSGSWTVGQNNAASGTVYTFGTISILNAYDVRLTVSDALGSTVSYIVNIASVNGVSFGLNGRCARFGGPITKPDRFECDWLTEFHDDIIAPKHVQSGYFASKAVAPDTTETIAVTFDTAFDTAPNVIAGILSNQTFGMGDCSVSVWNVSTTGFSLRLTNNYQATRKLGAYWIAISSGSKLPRIMEQPVSETVSAGSTVTFTVIASDATAYQWYYLAPGSSDWTAVSEQGGQTETYTFTAAAGLNGYLYRCVVSNTYGSATSDSAVLNVN